ncbi:histidine triad nucleotide-binding protein [Eubacteriales bacterium OttesenSCG-928-N13]|nr:histidine triad nucleotide-binding protein [Eubacteriales bacterium OttesenSCG-928-N13]
MDDCIFCKIIDGQIPSTKVYEDDRALAFLDINPQAPTHIVVIPKAHMRNILECAAREDDLLGYLMGLVAQLAKDQGLADKGFRVITNCGEHGAQSVEHFHIHLLGGAQLNGKMG